MLFRSGKTWTIDNGAVTDAKVATGIDAAKIANGNVSNAEYQYLDGVTSAIQTQIDAKQATLVSGTNIKTVNGSSLLGSGDLVISAGVSDGDKGDITVSSSGATWTIDNNVVSNAKFRQSPAFSIVGNPTSSTANVSNIAATIDGSMLMY